MITENIFAEDDGIKRIETCLFNDVRVHKNNEGVLFTDNGSIGYERYCYPRKSLNKERKEDKMKELTNESFWGGDADFDIAPEMEEVYEAVYGRSAVLWTSFDKDSIPTDNLENRPENYSTNGYTEEFETWGLELTDKAIENGCKTVEEVEDFFERYPKLH